MEESYQPAVSVLVDCSSKRGKNTSLKAFVGLKKNLRIACGLFHADVAISKKGVLAAMHTFESLLAELTGKGIWKITNMVVNSTVAPKPRRC